MGKYNRPVWPIIHCGKSCRDVKNWEEEILTMSTSLTEEEERSEYAKYYYMGQAEPSRENQKAAERGQELEAWETFMPEEFVKVMTSDQVNELHTGYRIMENGIGFGVARIKGEGISDQMVQYFCDHYRPEGDLFYKTWCPGVHMRHYSDMAIEDVGCGMEAIQFVNFFGPEELGFYAGMPQKDEKYINVNGGNGIAYPLHRIGECPRPAFSIRYTRELEDGRETIMFYWQGLHWKDGTAVRLIPRDYAIEEAAIRTQLQHCIYEQQTEYRLISEFCKNLI